MEVNIASGFGVHPKCKEVSALLIMLIFPLSDPSIYMLHFSVFLYVCFFLACLLSLLFVGCVFRHTLVVFYRNVKLNCRKKFNHGAICIFPCFRLVICWFTFSLSVVEFYREVQLPPHEYCNQVLLCIFMSFVQFI
jgi:hypothetical protein